MVVWSSTVPAAPPLGRRPDGRERIVPSSVAYEITYSTATPPSTAWAAALRRASALQAAVEKIAQAGAVKSR